MKTSLQQFNIELFQDVLAAADADGQFSEDVFFDLFCRHLADAGEIDTADRAHYVSPRGLRVDGYGGDPSQAAGVLSLIISDYVQDPVIRKLTASDMEALFKRLTNFLTKSLDAKFRDTLEETTPGFGLADLIATRWAGISKVRMFLISNRELSARVDGRKADEVKGTPVSYSVWDIERLHRFVGSGGREEVEIDLESDFGGGLPALPAHINDAAYAAYLLVVPGIQLAAIYDRWGARLLEQNVRVFLQARATVNKGIRNTVEKDPSMFFAFNNGVTATASSITSVQRNGQFFITGMENLQIVNGGQTTASIHAASRKKEVDLSRVFVQMKLSIVSPADYDAVVPKISEYANTQNKVTAADFFSNHPFHVRMEEFSRRIYAPSSDGTFRETKWFYERARGQYFDSKSRLSSKDQRKFELEFPKSHVFSKTDLAKYLNVWYLHPQVVSKGAQKNFSHFAAFIGKEWKASPDLFNELFYRHSIAKAIVFSYTEKLVSEQPWYQGGYRANVVAYAIAKIAHYAESQNRAFDFDAVWKTQSVSEDVKEALKIATFAVYNVLTHPPALTYNVTEWAKMQLCWDRVMALPLEFPAGFRAGLLRREEQKHREQLAEKDQKDLNGINAQTSVFRAGGAFWKNVVDWASERNLLSPKEAGVLEIATHIPDAVPSDKQSIIIVNALRRIKTEGCPYQLD